MPDAVNRRPGSDAHRLTSATPDEAHVFGACSPGWHSAASPRDAVADWIAAVRAADVERVCCLMPGGQPPGSRDAYLAAFGDDRVLHAPVPDGHLVSPLLLEDDVLPFLDEAVAADEGVVVYCLDGTGRTGQVLAAWLAHDRGYDPDRALAAVEATGRRPREPVEEGNATEAELHDLLAVFA